MILPVLERTVLISINRLCIMSNRLENTGEVKRNCSMLCVYVQPNLPIGDKRSNAGGQHSIRVHDGMLQEEEEESRRFILALFVVSQFDISRNRCWGSSHN